MAVAFALALLAVTFVAAAARTRRRSRVHRRRGVGDRARRVECRGIDMKPHPFPIVAPRRLLPRRGRMARTLPSRSEGSLLTVTSHTTVA